MTTRPLRRRRRDGQRILRSGGDIDSVLSKRGDQNLARDFQSVDDECGHVERGADNNDLAAIGLDKNDIVALDADLLERGAFRQHGAIVGVRPNLDDPRHDVAVPGDRGANRLPVALVRLCENDLARVVERPVFRHAESVKTAIFHDGCPLKYRSYH